MYNGRHGMPGLLPFSHTAKVRLRAAKKTISGDLQLFRDFGYRIEYSRRRSMSIIVSPDKGVTVKAPLRTPESVIGKFISEKSQWIDKSLRSFSTLQRLDNPCGYADGDSILLFGETHQLKLINSRRQSVRLNGQNTIVVEFVEKPDPMLTRSILENWFKFVAKKKLCLKFSEALVKYKDYGFKPTEFTVRTMKKRWGSCSSKGKIAISYDLIRLDEKYGEYVIAHELCHLRHHNHGADYYKLLSEVYPDWKKTRQELKQYLR